MVHTKWLHTVMQRSGFIRPLWSEHISLKSLPGHKWRFVWMMRLRWGSVCDLCATSLLLRIRGMGFEVCFNFKEPAMTTCDNTPRVQKGYAWAYLDKFWWTVFPQCNNCGHFLPRYSWATVTPYTFTWWTGIDTQTLIISYSNHGVGWLVRATVCRRGSTKT